MKYFTMKLYFAVILLIICLGSTKAQNIKVETIYKACSISSNLKTGEACIWYLYHSGWAVKTKNHFLIFDYWETTGKSSKQTLEHGYINADEIAQLGTVAYFITI